jgi:DNA-binding response OmpR family regulator
MLILEGHTSPWLSMGATALSEAATFQPQVVLLDIGMPGMSGYDVVRELRAREANKSALIVALTGYGQPEDRARAAEAGFTDHVRKPVVAEKLFALVKTHLASAESRVSRNV